MFFVDTETCGLYGAAVLIQYAEDEGPITLHEVWHEPIDSTLNLIDQIVNDTIIGFNLAFDWFHLCKTYTTLTLLREQYGNVLPRDYIHEYAVLEAEARFGPCLKPRGCLDLFLHARKGEYQTTMDRKDIRIKRVPTQLAQLLCDELDKRIILKDVYFERQVDPKRRWSVMDTSTPHFKNVILKFKPSSALKALAKDCLGIAATKFKDIEPPKKSMPVEHGWAPYATAPYYDDSGVLLQPSPKNWYGKYPAPGKITVHIDHWRYNQLARKYAEDDIVYTRGLYHYFDDPEINDVDSVLACLVGTVRWSGFSIDIDGIRARKEEALKRAKSCPVNYNSSKAVRAYLSKAMSETEQLVIQESTGKIILQNVSKWTMSDVCPDCYGAGCSKCADGLVESDKPHPAAERAKTILDARMAKKEVELYDKLITAGRFHASFKVIGTLSTRMSGADKLNPQGIVHSKIVRQCFPLADNGLELCGGDFSGFEVSLADAVYEDPDLRADILSGKKIHSLFGQFLFPGMTPDDIEATKGKPGNMDKYSLSKSGVFAMLYGGEGYTLSTKLGISQEVADEAFHRWIKKYKKWGEERSRVINMFCSMRQPEGLGSKVEWHEPADYIESIFGFRRYFTLENRICRALFDLAEKPPKGWEKLKLKVVRRDREQTACGATRSALFGAAFAIQASNMRAAANHVIQSSGAKITKGLQAKVWDLQPVGVHPFVVKPMNIHDELMIPHNPEVKHHITEIVKQYVESLKSRVPLIDIDWSENLKSWADK